MNIYEPIPILDEEFNDDGTEIIGKYHRQMEVYDYAYICSVCGHEIFFTNYCSNCGVKLR